MTDAIQFISNNNLASVLVATIILAIISRIWKWRLDRHDSKKIFDFMLKSKTETDSTFRSTEAIASHTKICESRVELLCSKHPRIKRNAKAKQSWRIDN